MVSVGGMALGPQWWCVCSRPGEAMAVTTLVGKWNALALIIQMVSVGGMAFGPQRGCVSSRPDEAEADTTLVGKWNALALIILGVGVWVWIC